MSYIVGGYAPMGMVATKVFPALPPSWGFRPHWVSVAASKRAKAHRRLYIRPSFPSPNDIYYVHQR